MSKKERSFMTFMITIMTIIKTLKTMTPIVTMMMKRQKKKMELMKTKVDSDEESEVRISNSLFQDKIAQLKDLEAELEMEKGVIHFYQMENKRVPNGPSMNARTLKARRKPSLKSKT